MTQEQIIDMKNRLLYACDMFVKEELSERIWALWISQGVPDGTYKGSLDDYTWISEDDELYNDIIDSFNCIYSELITEEERVLWAKKYMEYFTKN